MWDMRLPAGRIFLYSELIGVSGPFIHILGLPVNFINIALRKPGFFLQEFERI